MICVCIKVLTQPLVFTYHAQVSSIFIMQVWQNNDKHQNNQLQLHIFIWNIHVKTFLKIFSKKCILGLDSNAAFAPKWLKKYIILQLFFQNLPFLQLLQLLRLLQLSGDPAIHKIFCIFFTSFISKYIFNNNFWNFTKLFNVIFANVMPIPNYVSPVSQK